MGTHHEGKEQFLLMNFSALLAQSVPLISSHLLGQCQISVNCKETCIFSLLRKPNGTSNPKIVENILREQRDLTQEPKSI